MLTFKGDLTVEPNKFRLRAERMIIRQRPIIRDDNPATLKQISFDLFYTPTLDDPKEYRLSGIADRRVEGYYESHIGPSNGYEGKASIYILRANVNEEGCFFEGFWLEEGEGAWKFFGNLEPFSETA